MLKGYASALSTRRRPHGMATLSQLLKPEEQGLEATLRLDEELPRIHLPTVMNYDI